MSPNRLILLYLLVISLVTFLLYAIDKRKARKAKWRIPESTLLGMAVIGGSIGALCGMYICHHKTLHKKFKYGVPAILIAQLIILVATVSGTFCPDYMFHNILSEK